LQRDGANHVVADVLGDLEVDRVRLLVGRDGDLGGQQVVLVGHGVDAELDVDDRAGDAGDAPDPTRSGGVLFGHGGSHGFSLPSHLDSARALAPPEISEIAWVISACRAWLASRVYFLMSSSALSVADFMARWRAASSEAAAWRRQLKMRALT